MRWVFTSFSLLLSCSSSEAPASAPALDAGSPAAADVSSKQPGSVSFERTWPDPLAQLPHGPDQTARVCARPGNDPVRDVFCGAKPQTVQRLGDLRLGLKFGVMQPGQPTVIDGVAVAGHSTSLAAHSVSTINPRVIAMRMAAPGDVVALGFTRGEQFAELATFDRTARTLRFYVLGFRQACNEAPDGCKPGDLLTPAVEEDWREVSLYDDTDLTNTALDCMTCHQAGGPDTPRLLRMNELVTPWTHWFAQDNEGGKALIDDYLAAKGDERLAGLDAMQLTASRPTDLEQLIRFVNKQPQTNEFKSEVIEQEVRASASGQPVDNSVPGNSPTWRGLFDLARSGAAPTIPYHDVKVTDATKLARASAAYAAFRSGQLAREELPDIRDVLPDDESLLAEMGMMTTPGADGAAVLLEACSLCHNPRLDPALTRARFRADLSGLSREEKDEAIRRLQLPPQNPLAMPPARLRVLSAQARARAIDALQR